MTGTMRLAIPALDDLAFVGEDLVRPECVVTNSAGQLFTPDWRGGIAMLEDGRTVLTKAEGSGPSGGIKPNGIALTSGGEMLIAHLADAEGGVWRMKANGRLEPWILAVEGRPLPPTNFVHVDQVDRTWITVSTRMVPRTLARSAEIADGFIVLVEGDTPRVVAEGVGYTNEAKVDPAGQWLYVNETFGRRVSRYPILTGSRLGQREVYVEFEEGVYPDGLEFDEEGGIWITSIYSNRLIRIDGDRQQQLLLEDNDPDYLATIERAFRDGSLVHRQPEEVPSLRLKNISNVAFGGNDRKSVYLGCLQGNRIATFRSPVAGVRPAHWDRRWRD
ncbi:MAG: SMP-30/gluconolactonase/LRE family protein [Hyphomicrobiales bacterium]|nr:SMP-30/gluconolactonase/LRE family protein [Hyphomicrobiales bacterium]